MEKITAKETVFDRIEQSFELFKNNFIKLILPIFGFTFLTKTIFITIASFLMIKYGGSLAELFQTKENIENLSFLNYSSQIVIAIIVLIILIILYLTLYIPFFLATIKSIKDGYNGEEINVKENIIYGFKNIWKSFQTYWYIFAYVALIPALIGIVGGVLFIYGMQYNDNNYTKIGGIISGVALLIFLVFSIYRGTKSSFALSSAIDENKFTKKNFINSIEITKEQFWRILGNMILVSIIISLVMGIINSSIGGLFSSFDYSNTELLGNIRDKNPEEITKNISKIFESYSPIKNFLGNLFSDFINTVSSVFMIIFTYIFYKRLKIENTKSDDKIEL